MTEVVAVDPGQKITEPGIYDIPNAWYHDDCCDGPSISSTGLRQIEQRSPAHYWATSPLNPDAEPMEATKALDYGAAAHCLLLEPDLFEAQFAVSPFSDFARNEEIEGKLFRKSDKKAWKDAQEEAGKTIITKDDYAAITAAKRALAEHPLVKDGLFDGLIEKSVIWQDEETGVWLKARPDCIPAGAILVDYKSAVSAHPRDIRKALTDHGYHMQLALAVDGIHAVLGDRIEHVALAVQEKKPPYVVNVAPVEQAALYRGRQQNRRAIRAFAECIEKGDWPGYPELESEIGLLPWAESDLDQQENYGILPKIEDAA